jgi:hypothetical protein
MHSSWGTLLRLAAGLMLNQAFRAAALDLSSISGPAIVEQVHRCLLSSISPANISGLFIDLHCASTYMATHSLGPGQELQSQNRNFSAQLLHLATFSDDPLPAVTRIIFTPNDMKARQ